MAGVSLVVGLGNPGEQYAATRHNVGFRVMDRLVSRAGGTWEEKDSEGLVARVSVAGRELWAAKPLTFMNLSGRFVGRFARYYRVPPESVLVVSDDIDLPLGRIRIRLKGSSGGQRGLESVIEAMGTSDIPRVRLGVGPKPSGWDAADFVLGRFRKEEAEAAEEMVGRAAAAVEAAVSGGVESAMNAYNKAAA